jgi:hypothetical protein
VRKSGLNTLSLKEMRVKRRSIMLGLL